MSDEPMRILLVEDEAAHAELVQRAFEVRGEQVRLDVVSTLAAAHAHLAAGPPPPDLIIADWRLPDGQSTDLLPADRDRRAVPFVIMTSYGNERVAVEAMKAGALDYVVKSEATLADMPHIAERAIREWNILAERASMESQLRESEERYRTLAEAAQDSIYVIGRDDRVQYLNSFAARQLGGQPADFVGKPHMALFATEVSEGQEHSLRTALDTGQPIYVESKTPFPSGERWLGTWLTPLKEASGEPYAVLGISRDITERKQADAQIRKLNRTLSAISEASQALVRATEETELLQRICRIIVEAGGYRLAWVGLAEQDEAKTVQPVAWAGYEAGYLSTLDITWADTDRGRGPTGTAIRTGRPVIARDILTDPHYGPWRDQSIQRGYVSSIALPLLSNGQSLGALNIYAAEPEAFDLEESNLLAGMADNLAYGIVALRTRTARQQAEEAIKRLNQDLERRARGLAALNKAGQIMTSTLELNTLLERLMEQVDSLLDVEGTSVMLCEPTSDQACPELVFAAVTGPGASKLAGTRLPTTASIASWVARERQSVLVANAENDSRFYHGVDQVTGMTTRSLLAVPLISKGSVLGVVETINKRSGTFDQHDAEVLEALCSSAAIAIENARLFATEQQRAATLAQVVEQQRELDRLQREFIQNASHELRTPLSIIRGYAEVLESGDLGEMRRDQLDAVKIIVRRVQMLSRLVDDMTAVMQMEAHKLHREPVDLGQLALALGGDFEVTAARSGLDLTVDVTPDLPSVSGDSMGLRRVLDNLVGNAFKFTPAGGCVSVRLWQAGDQIILQVADTGVGIPRDQLARIFERFYQVNGTAARRHGGMGLGLTLVKGIVEAHGGQITVTSEAGQGTTFTVSLPVDPPASRKIVQQEETVK